MQITFQFGPCDHSMYPQKYIQDKAWWYLFKINGQTVAGSPKYCHCSGWNDHIFTQTYTNYMGIMQITTQFIYIHDLIPIIGILFDKNKTWVSDLSSWPYKKFSHPLPTVFEEMPSCFLLNDFFRYFTLLNCLNW